MGGLTVYAKSSWDVAVQGQNGMQVVEHTTDSSNVEESVVYSELKGEKAPGVISLHGPPASYKNLTRKEDNELKGLDKYIDEYKGNEPLVVSFGHQGKAGHQVTTNSQGSTVIYLCTNNEGNYGTSPQGTSFDIVSEGGKIQRIDKIDYGYYEEAA